MSALWQRLLYCGHVGCLTCFAVLMHPCDGGLPSLWTSRRVSYKPVLEAACCAHVDGCPCQLTALLRLGVAICPLAFCTVSIWHILPALHIATPPPAPSTCLLHLISA